MNEPRPSSMKDFLRRVDTISLMMMLMMSTLCVALCILLLSSIPLVFWKDVAGPVASVFFFYVLARVLKRWARS